MTKKTTLRDKDEGSTPLAQQVYDVAGFCKAHFISRAFFYKLQQLGRGPKVMKVGKRTLVSSAAAAEWVERMERSGEVTRDGD